MMTRSCRASTISDRSSGPNAVAIGHFSRQCVRTYGRRVVATTLAQELGAFVSSVDIEDVPPETLERLCDDIVDIAGCAVLGHDTPWGAGIVEYVRALGEPGGATVWGSDVRANAGSAALALGTLGHSFDFDDYHPAAKLHPATVVLPAALALAEAVNASGSDVLTASAVGFETMIRLSLATGPVDTMLNGFHLTGICGSVGAAAAAAHLLKLDAAQAAHALGLAATQSSGLMGFLHDGSETKRLHAGRSAQAGILAAQLAARGFTGPRRVFELEHGGFCHAFGTNPDPARLVSDLGGRWHAGEVSFKRYSCCGSIHSTLDLVAEAVAQLGPWPTGVSPLSYIDDIEVMHSPAVISQCGWRYEPGDVLHAQMSIQYCVAVLLLEGAVLPRQFRHELLADPDVMTLAARVRVTPDADVGRKYPALFASHVNVRAGAASVDLQTDHPKGAAARPLTTAEVDEKFHNLTMSRIGREQRDTFTSAARNLRAADSVSTVIASLRTDDRGVLP